VATTAILGLGTIISILQFIMWFESKVPKLEVDLKIPEESVSPWQVKIEVTNVGESRARMGDLYVDPNWPGATNISGPVLFQRIISPGHVVRHEKVFNLPNEPGTYSFRIVITYKRRLLRWNLEFYEDRKTIDFRYRGSQVQRMIQRKRKK
ncbi:MAG: hypothetical protein ACFFGZ_11220, partial [Candidatus Thorarchaeota archaeon]